MISIVFHFGIIFGTFEVLVLLYATYLLFHNKAEAGYVSSTLLRQLQMVFVATLGIVSLDLVTRTLSSFQIIELDLYWFQGLLAFAYLFGIFMHAFALTRDKKRLRLTLSLWGFVAFIFTLFWIKTNVLEGFKPLIPNPDVILILHLLWIVSGAFWVLSEWWHRDRENEIKCALDVTVARLWGFFILSQGLTLIGSHFDLTLFFAMGCVLALPNLFLLFLMVDAEFVSIDYYKKPFLYLKERIIIRMILTLSILIIIAFELINYATLFIVKTELAQAKTVYFQQKIVDAQQVLHQTFNADRETLMDVLDHTDKTTSEYLVGISIFNQVAKIKDLNKLILLSPTKIPLLTVTPEELQFSYSSKLASSFDGLLAQSVKKGYCFAYYEHSQKPIVVSRVLRPDGKIAYFVIAYFNAGDVFQKLNRLAFERNGEIQVLGKDNSILFSTRVTNSLRDEYKHERYLNVSEEDPLTGLIVLVRQPEVDAFSGLQNAQYNSFFFTTFTIVGFLMIAFFFLRMIEAPLRKLQIGARSIGAGDLNVTIDIREKNEFYDLARAFNYMVKDLKKLQNEQLKNEQVLSISNMSVGLNHEINNPLAAILMSNQMVQKLIKSFGPEVSEDGKKKLELLDATCQRIDEEGKRIKKILEDIQHINEPIMEDYVDGTKMMKVKFD